jgi:hypothetical protein
LIACLLLAESAHGAPPAAHQWQVSEIRLTAESDYADPFAFERVRLMAVFRGPGNERLAVPGFWDGQRDWAVRFTPSAPGRWEYETSFTDVADAGLHGRRGTLDVRAATRETRLREHGGFVHASSNGRYLTYADGTPFFWLGDTWWRVPSGFVPFDDFVRMVDRRAAHGFTVFQALGYAPFDSADKVGVFAATGSTSDDVIRYWREVDRYLEYAEAKGLLGVIGLGGTAAFDAADLRALLRLWHYYVARYGAYPITFLIAQEYNVLTGDPAARFAKIRSIAQLIRDIDPYGRAISAHPAVLSIDDFRAWSEPWYGFAMIQGGHFSRVQCEVYERLRARVPRRPVVQAELNYEGFARGGFVVDADEVRRTAYATFQCGAYGYTYGAQGLYAAVKNASPADATSKWGPVITWEAGLALAGGAQLQHLRAFYESMEWWKLEPWDRTNVDGDILVKSAEHSAIVVYFAPAGEERRKAALRNLRDGSEFSYDWFDPRTGRYAPSGGSLVVRRGRLELPNAPSLEDWLLRLRARR